MCYKTKPSQAKVSFETSKTVDCKCSDIVTVNSHQSSAAVILLSPCCDKFLPMMSFFEFFLFTFTVTTVLHKMLSKK